MHSSRHWKVLSAAAVIALTASACSSLSKPVTQTKTAELSEFKIEAQTAPADRAFKLAVSNKGTAVHQLTIETGSGKSVATGDIRASGNESIEVPALKAGSYHMYCAIPGHRQAGMEAMLIVAATDAKAGGDKASVLEAHRSAMAAFPAKTEGTGGQPLAPTVVDGVKVFTLTPKAVSWEVTPGHRVEALAYNGQIPGPEIRVNQGDKIKVVVHNSLTEPTTVHFHGIELPNAMDGVPFVTQDPIEPGKEFNYEFTVGDPPGTYMYHSHYNALEQVGRGLLGAFIVEPPRKDWDIEQTLVLGDGELGYNINGKGFPATAPISVPLGKRLLIRFLNEGQQIHPMHLHGVHFTVIARDGRPISPYVLDTLSVAPGERYDVIATATLPGVWALHCHILSHVESEHGMFGMVTALIVK